jgi:hypothetical protein
LAKDEARQQALLNEYKGNLFEYLVALSLAKHNNRELDFIKSLSDDFRNMLRIQESFIRTEYPHLLEDLPLLASSVVSEMTKLNNFQQLQGVRIIGKVAGASHDENYGEADLLLKSSVELPVSLKLSKANAYVNTKSGGIKSFVEKYFHCPSAKSKQQELNTFVDEQFHAMSFKLHEVAGLSYEFNYNNWIQAGLPELPGKLDEDYKVVLHPLYYAVSNKLYEILEFIKNEDETSFARGLLALIGASTQDLYQVTCFYKMQENHYKLNDVLIEDSKTFLEEVTRNEISPNKEGLAYFDVYLPGRILQIRIKPMNKFTTPSFKVNCSVKKIN